jgi:hypothetical protein
MTSALMGTISSTGSRLIDKNVPMASTGHFAASPLQVPHHKVRVRQQGFYQFNESICYVYIFPDDEGIIWRRLFPFFPERDANLFSGQVSFQPCQGQ